MTAGRGERLGRPTMRDVAEIAGVGLKTVSRVVNGEGKVSAETRARVDAAIAEVGYRPNEVARSMRAMRTGRGHVDIGLLVGDLSNPFFASLAWAVISVVRDRGYAAVLASADEDPDGERDAIEGLLARQVAGLIVVPGADDYRYLQPEIERGTPLVFVDRPGGRVSADEVVIDNVAGARAAVGHLADHGHRRIAAIVPPSRWTTAQRLEGYLAEMTQRFGDVDEGLVVRTATGGVDAATRAADELLERPDPPTAFFTATGFMTQGLLRRLGHSHSMAIVGFDDVPLAELLEVPVSVVVGDPATLGRIAARALFARIDGETGPPRRHVLEPVFIPRGSGERPPAAYHTSNLS
jgi:LacI family transcriptional regulator